MQNDFCPRFEAYLNSKDVKLELQVQEKYYDLAQLDPAKCKGENCFDQGCERHKSLKIDSGIHEAQINCQKLKKEVAKLLN
jgi:hypothetical protein